MLGLFQLSCLFDDQIFLKSLEGSSIWIKIQLGYYHLIVSIRQLTLKDDKINIGVKQTVQLGNSF